MKKVDRNGFWTIEGNPISKVGIFPYLGSQIDSSLQADKVYMVLRPAEELFNQEAIDSFNTVPVPLVDEHTMIGDEYTPAEKKGIDGVVQNIRQDGDVLVGDIAIYSEEMKKKITHGKKELSMGYFCTYDIQEGEYNGEHYDAIQRNIRSNHIALVDKGRCGHDVRVFDKWCFDAAISITNEFNKQEQEMDTKKETEMDTKDAEFEESKHPRAENGQFTSKGSGSSGSTSNTNSENKRVVRGLNSIKSVKVGISPAAADLCEGIKINLGKELPGIDIHKLYSREYNNPNKGRQLAKEHLLLNKLIRRLDTFSKNNGTKRFNKDISSLEAAREEVTKQFNQWAKSNKKNTASDSGCRASKDDAMVNQSKLKELRKMIDKEKLAALKDLVAMLESDEPVATQEDEGEIEEKKEDLLVPDMSKSSDEENTQEEVEEVEEEDEDDIEKEKEEKLQKSEDAMSRKIFSMLADRDALAKKVTPIIGGFDYSRMTVDQVARYACDKLDIDTNTPKAAIDGYLKGYRKSEMYSMDTAQKEVISTNAQIEAYLKGE